MGVPPLLGRTPTADDARPGAPPVVALGYRFWQRQFAGDPNVLGRQLQLNDTSRTVIGVMPKRFMWRGADVYVPIVFERGHRIEGVRSVHLLGRLKPGVTDAQAEADLRTIVADLKAREPAEFLTTFALGFCPSRRRSERDQRDVWVLFGAVSVLLLIACVNVSNLMLSRPTSGGEMACGRRSAQTVAARAAASGRESALALMAAGRRRAGVRGFRQSRLVRPTRFRTVRIASTGPCWDSPCSWPS